MKKWFILVLVLSLCGCVGLKQYQKYYDARGEAMKYKLDLRGLTGAEIQERFGQPLSYSVMHNQFIGTTETLRYKWSSLDIFEPERSMTIFLTNGKVTSVHY